jgi:hypothetical protein
LLALPCDHPFDRTARSDRDGRLTSRELEPFVCAPGLRDILCHDLNPLVDALIQQHLEGRPMHLDFADFAQLVDRTPRLAMLLDAVPLLGHAAANAWTLQQHVAAAQRAAQESAMKRTGAAGGNNNTSGSGTSGSGSGNSIGGASASGSAGGLSPPMPLRAPTMLGQAIARPSMMGNNNGASTTPVWALPALILKDVPQPPPAPSVASASDSGSGSGAPPPPNGIVELAKSASASRLSPASSAASLHASSLPVAAADAKPAMPPMVPQPPQPLLPPSSGALLSPRSRSFKTLPPPMPPMRE